MKSETIACRPKILFIFGEKKKGQKVDDDFAKEMGIEKLKLKIEIENWKLKIKIEIEKSIFKNFTEHW